MNDQYKKNNQFFLLILLEEENGKNKILKVFCINQIVRSEFFFIKFIFPVIFTDCIFKNIGTVSARYPPPLSSFILKCHLGKFYLFGYAYPDVFYKNIKSKDFFYIFLPVVEC